MKKEQSLRSQLGITQEEAAMLLGISIGQLAMYETGKRDLPSAVKLALTTMWSFVQNYPPDIEKKYPILDTEQSALVKVIERELVTNKYQQVLIAQKIKRLENTYEKSRATLKLVTFLRTNPSEKTKPSPALIALLEDKALKKIAQSGIAMQTKWRLKLEGLKQHEMELKKLKR